MIKSQDKNVMILSVSSILRNTTIAESFWWAVLFIYFFTARSKQIDWQFLHKESRQILPYQLFIVNTPYVFPMFVNVSLTHLGKPSQIDCTPEAGSSLCYRNSGGLSVPPCHWASVSAETSGSWCGYCSLQAQQGSESWGQEQSQTVPQSEL